MNETQRKTPSLRRSEEKALREAGFGRATASRLATLNQWVFPAVLLVNLVALLWIGIHLWPDIDAASWQAWCDQNPGFFEPLDVGSTVGIVTGRHSHTGLLITRAPSGVRVQRHLWFAFDEVPVGFVVAPEAAQQWLQLRYEDAGFWDQWQSLAAGPGIHIYQQIRLGAVGAEGYDAFLRRLRSTSVVTQ